MTEGSRNESRYRKLSVPKESPDKANEDINAFFKEMGELRAVASILFFTGRNDD